MNAENTQMTPLTKTLALRKPGLFSAYQNYIEPVIGRIVTGSVSLRKIQRKDNDEVRALIQRVLIRKGGVGADIIYTMKNSTIFMNHIARMDQAFM